MTTDRRDFLKYTLGSMIVIGASGYLAACGGDDDSASGSTSTSAGATTTKPVELQKISVMMPFAVGINFIADTAAAAGGFFKDNGLDMNLQFAQSAPLALQQLAAGNVDVIRNAPIAVVKAVSQEGAPFVAIGMPNQEMLYRLVSTEDKPVDDLASLEGKTVGMATLAGNAEDTFVLVLKGAGVNPDSVTRVAVGNDAAALAFVEDGRVDALFATLESTATMKAKGQKPHIAELEGVNPLLGTAIVTTQQKITDKRDASGRVLAFRRSVDPRRDGSRPGRRTDPEGRRPVRRARHGRPDDGQAGDRRDPRACGPRPARTTCCATSRSVGKRASRSSRS